MGHHLRGGDERRRRLIRLAVGVFIAAAVLVGLDVAAGAWIHTSQRPRLGPPPTSTPPTAATSASGEPTTAGTSAASPAGIRIAFTGDMLASDDLLAQARRNANGAGYDFTPMLTKVAPIIGAADWAICHQETPISADDTGIAGYPRFNAPLELAAAERRAGYDACDTASNHTADLGDAGVTATLDTLDHYGIRHTGSARTAAEAAQPTIYDVRGVKVGHLAYTFALNTGTGVTAPYMVNLIDPARIRADAHRLRLAGADIVIVSLHMGTERVALPSAYQREIAAAVMQSPDVDLIVGSHAHVVQPVQRLPDGRWIVYGLGDFLAQQEGPRDDPTRDGVIIEATFGKVGGRYRVTGMGYVPTWVNAPTDRIELAPAFSRDRTVRALTAMGAPLVDLTPR